MKISEIKGYVPASELRTAKPAGGSQQGEVTPLSAERTLETAESEREVKEAREPSAMPPLMDFQLDGVRNDFSGKYRRAALALEGTIYRLEQSQLALVNSSDDAEGAIALPENSNLQQTANGLAMLAHFESVKFKTGS